jgi:hypothetical protein
MKPYPHCGYQLSLSGAEKMIFEQHLKTSRLLSWLRLDFLELIIFCLYATNTFLSEIAFIVLQMENCSDGFNVPREHTAKLYIVGKRIMGSIGKFLCANEKWSRFSKIRVEGQISKSKKKLR